MNQINTAVSENNPSQWPALASGMRELSEAELDMASGGVPFLIPPVVTAIKWGAAIYGGAILHQAGVATWNYFAGPEESCMM